MGKVPPPRWGPQNEKKLGHLEERNLEKGAQKKFGTKFGDVKKSRPPNVWEYIWAFETPQIIGCNKPPGGPKKVPSKFVAPHKTFYKKYLREEKGLILKLKREMLRKFGKEFGKKEVHQNPGPLEWGTRWF